MRFVAALNTWIYGVYYLQGAEVDTTGWTRKMLLQFLGNGIIQASYLSAGALTDKLEVTGNGVETEVNGEGQVIVTVDPSFDELSDVDMTGRTDGQVPVWSESAQLWLPGDAGEGTPLVAEDVRDIVGTALVEGAGIDITVDDPGDTITIASTVTQYTDEQVRDVVGTALVEGAGIDITVNDAGDTITITNTGAAGLDAEAVRDLVGTTLVAGSNVTITVDDPGDTITIASTGSGGLDAEGVRDVIGASLIAGTGIDVIVDDPSDLLVIASTITQYTDEMARDAIGTALVAGAGISITPDDGSDFILIEATGGAAGEQSFSWADDLEVGVAPFKLYNDEGRERLMTKVRVTVGTSPTGSSAIFDVLKNGSSIWPSGTKPTISAGGTTDFRVPVTTSWADGDYLQVEIEQVGSTLPGADMTLTVNWV